MFTKILSGFFAGYWFILAICVFCGLEISNFTIGCGLLVASIEMLSDVLREL